MVFPPRETRWPLSWAPGFDDLELRPVDLVTGIVVHRIEVSQEDPSYGDDPFETARFFAEHPIGRKATGGSMPYPIVIENTGKLTQALPLQRISYHARNQNPTTVGVALVGDFRRKAPSDEQWSAAVEVCASLASQFGLDPDMIHAHDALSEASHDPDKICPGALLSMPDLRAQTKARVSLGQPSFEFYWKDS